MSKMSHSGTLQEQAAVITGAGRGLGRAIALALAQAGARVFICDVVPAELEQTVKAIRAGGRGVESHLLDLSRAEECQSFITRVLSAVSHVGVLVNNAAVLRLAPVEQLSVQEWSETLGVNLTAPFLFTRGFLPGMKEHGGSIINVSSRAGALGFAQETAYCASKFALEGFTRALATELQGTRVSVNTVTPGLLLKPTSLSEAEAEVWPDRGKWQDPSLVAPAFVYLAGLRGEISGLRFDAHRLARALSEEGPAPPPDRVRALAE